MDLPYATARLRRRNQSHSRRAGLTLVEVMISVAILGSVTLGTFGVLLSAKKMTDFSRKQMLVDTAIQGLAEQLRTKTSTELLGPTWITPLSSISAALTYVGSGKAAPSIPVDLDNNPTTPLTDLILSPLPCLTAAQVPAGAIPASGTTPPVYGDIDGDGINDVGYNRLRLDVRGTNGQSNAAATTADDIDVYVMVWVEDYTLAAAPLSVTSRAITIVYTWTYQAGRIKRKMVDSIRVIRTFP